MTCMKPSCYYFGQKINIENNENMYNIFKYDNKKNRYQKVKSIQYNHWYIYNTDLHYC